MAPILTTAEMYDIVGWSHDRESLLPTTRHTPACVECHGVNGPTEGMVTDGLAEYAYCKIDKALVTLLVNRPS